MKALILVDIQNDFTPTGALPVPEGDQIIPVVNNLQKKFDFVVATQDWHPENHKSFAVHHQKQPGEVILLNGIEQVLWPVHCVQDSKGAEFIKGLEQSGIREIFQKGLDAEVDSYSGFFDNDHQRSTGLDKYLKNEGIDEVFIVGLALDYCVKFTAMDAKALGLKTFVFRDATRAVNINQGDDEKAVDEMKAAGIKVITSSEY
ncbi:bifunctional nicotinamidase/pyrazinamidase [bacterium]|nr:bifunctional nicotinamidase/pyrazinamidase [bacterium]